MRTNKIGKIAVGVSGHKQSKFDYSHDIENTMNMGEVRPLIVKEMKPHSSLGIKKDNIIMTAPLNVYTYGKIDYETISHFVPEEKIFPRIGSFLSGEAVACPNDPNGWESVPETKPSTIAGILASYMLIGSKLNVWRSTDPIEKRDSEQLSQFYFNGQSDAKNLYKFAPMDITTRENFVLFDMLTDPQGDYLLSYGLNGSYDRAGTNPNSESKYFNSGEKSYLWLNLTRLNVLIQEANALPYSNDAGLLPAGYYGNMFNRKLRLGAEYGVDHDLWVPLSNSIAEAFGMYESDDEGVKRWINPQADVRDVLGGTYVPTDIVSPENADVVIPYHFREGDFDYLAFGCFRLSDAGKRFFSLLKACEMPTDIGCVRPVNCEKLLATYMAYFESFGLQTTDAVQNHPFSRLIEAMRNDMYWLEPVGSNLHCPDNLCLASITRILDAKNLDSNHVIPFILCLFDMWLTDGNDFASIHQNSGAGLLGDGSIPSTLYELNKFVHSPTFGYNHGQFVLPSDSMPHFNGSLTEATIGTFVQDASAKHSPFDERLLMKLAKWTNRQSILGHDIEKTLKAMGYGEVYNAFGCEFIGKTSTRLDIAQCPSLADTYDGVKGRELGEIGAKSITYDDSQRLTYETRNGGFWITLCYIRPVSGYSQSVDCENFDYERGDVYVPEFDGEGFENTPMSQFFNTARCISLTNVLRDPSCETFGVVPRDSHRKVCRDVMLGGFALPSVRNTFSPYHLSRYTSLGDHNKVTARIDNLADFEPFVLGMDKPLVLRDIPRCGLWTRSPYRYEWLCQLQRIFSNSQVSNFDANLNTPSYGDFGSNFFIFSEDNFIIHTHVDGYYNAPMKPIEVSYDSFDQEKGANGSESKA